MTEFLHSVWKRIIKAVLRDDVETVKQFFISPKNTTEDLEQNLDENSQEDSEEDSDTEPYMIPGIHPDLASILEFQLNELSLLETIDVVYNDPEDEIDEIGETRNMNFDRLINVSLMELLYYAFSNGSFEVLRYLHDLGFPLPECMLISISEQQNHVEDLRLIKRRLPCMAYCIEKGRKWTFEDWVNIINEYRLDGVILLNEAGIPWGDDFVTMLMTRYNDEDRFGILKYAHEHGAHLPQMLKINIVEEKALDNELLYCYVYLQKHRPDITFQLSGSFTTSNRRNRIICRDSTNVFWTKFWLVKRAIRVVDEYITRKYGRRRTLERTCLIKDELIEKSWHPDRFSAWCLDEDQKKDIDNRFD